MGPFSLPFAVPVMLPVIAFHHGNAMSRSKLAMKSAACCFPMLALTGKQQTHHLCGTTPATTHLVSSDAEDVI